MIKDEFLVITNFPKIQRNSWRFGLLAPYQEKILDLDLKNGEKYFKDKKGELCALVKNDRYLKDKISSKDLKYLKICKISEIEFR
jgi:hypothetical protein